MNEGAGSFGKIDVGIKLKKGETTHSLRDILDSYVGKPVDEATVHNLKADLTVFMLELCNMSDPEQFPFEIMVDQSDGDPTSFTIDVKRKKEGEGNG
jgi:hypothetical protein